MLLVIDNYDSFVHNLARCLRRLGQETLVVRNDALDAAEVERLEPQAIVLSPGPCTPHQAGCSLDVVRRLHHTTPLLGVCLGHQTIAAALGARIVRAPEPRHGQASDVLHAGDGLFAGLPSPMPAARYHSLVVDAASLPDELAITARTSDGVVMALAHRRRPVFGLQFHPESILTPDGYRVLANFLRLAGLSAREPPAWSSELTIAAPSAPPLPDRPVTF